MVVSPRMSFEGYSLRKALYRNKDELKALIALIVGANYFTGFDPKVLGLSVAAAVVALAGKLIFDAFDYWMGEIDN